MKKIHDKPYQIIWGQRIFQHELDRKKRKLVKQRKFTKHSAKTRIHHNFFHPLMEFLRKQFKGENVAKFDKERGSWVIQIPPVFSFVKQPEAAINVIFSLVQISKQSSNNVIHFDHSKLMDMDIGASAVLDIVTISMKEEWIRRGLQYGLSGAFPESEKLRQILMTMGITKQLNVKGAEPSEIAKKIIIQFPLYRGFKQEKSEIGGPQHRDTAVSNLVKYLDDCLVAASNYELSEEGKRNITKWAGEIITNAEEHSGHHRWFMIGYMIPHVSKVKLPETDDSEIIGECQLAIFGFGQSIYDSLSSKNTSSITKNQISDLVSKHTKFFNLFNKYSEQDLWTLYALQDGVSRFSPAPGENTRGKGTVEMIEAFHHFRSLDQECETEMSLISGSTWIRFSDKYHMKEQEVSGGVRKIIAFNDKNSLDDKPDSAHVRSLLGAFPGTLLTFKIFIDNSFLEKAYKARKSDPKGQNARD